MKENEEIEVGMPLLSFVGWGGTLFFIFCAVMSAIHETIIVSAMFIPFVLLEFFLYLFCGRVRLNTEGIGYRNKFGDYFMSWVEIETVESGSGNFVLGNKEKRITMPVPGYWGGKQKSEAVAILADFLDSKDIQIKETFRAIFQFPKHTKIGIEQGSGGNG